jgi:hypothetical protein
MLTQAPSQSRQRIQDTLNHRQPDRVPIDIGGSGTTGIHVSCVAALREHFGLERRPVKVIEPFQMLGEVEDDLKDALGLDVVVWTVNKPDDMERLLDIAVDGIISDRPDLVRATMTKRGMPVPKATPIDP